MIASLPIELKATAPAPAGAQPASSQFSDGAEQHTGSFHDLVQSAVQSHSREASEDAVKPATPNARKKPTTDDAGSSKPQSQTDANAQVQQQQQVVIPAAQPMSLADLMAGLPVQAGTTDTTGATNSGSQVVVSKDLGATQAAPNQAVPQQMVSANLAKTFPLASTAAAIPASPAPLTTPTDAQPVKADGQTTNPHDSKQAATPGTGAVAKEVNLPLVPANGADQSPVAAVAANAPHVQPAITSADQQNKVAPGAHKDSTAQPPTAGRPATTGQSAAPAAQTSASQQQAPAASQASVPTTADLHSKFAAQGLTQAINAFEKLVTPASGAVNTKLPAIDSTASKSTDAASTVQTAPAHTKTAEHTAADNSSSSNSGQSDKGNQAAGNGTAPSATAADSIKPQVAAAVEGVAVNAAAKGGDQHAPAVDASKQTPAGVAAEPAMVQGTAGDEARVSSINTAKLMQSVNESGMRIGVQSADYGNIAIHTLMDKGGITSQISVEHADLAKVIAAGLPELRSALGGHDQLEVKVAMHGQLGAQMDMSQRGGGEARGEARRNTQTFASAVADSQTVAAEIEAAPAAYRVATMSGNTGRLDVRI